MKLIIANKNYSSWSLRPWLALKHIGVPFDEVIIPLRHDDTAQKIAVFSPAGKVPILQDEDVTVWETLAILEYLAERFPDAGLWPTDRAARALARSISSEMHAGFRALRMACPMNLRRAPARLALDADTLADVERMTAIWRDARERFGEGGPFLFGQFSAADAMFSAAATRFRTYAIEVDEVSAAYIAAIHDLAPFKLWLADAVNESWVLPHDEIDQAPDA